jgi:hypothetical protein
MLMFHIGNTSIEQSRVTSFETRPRIGYRELFVVFLMAEQIQGLLLRI